MQSYEISLNSLKQSMQKKNIKKGNPTLEFSLMDFA
jgi:hypothetical protein